MSTQRGELFTTIRTEGGLLPPSLLARVAGADGTLPGLGPDDYHLASGERLTDRISVSWRRLVGAWKSFTDALAGIPADNPAQGLTYDRWLLILFAELGYGRLQRSAPVQIGEHTYPISHAWGTTPIHLVGAHVDIDRRTRRVAGAARISPQGLVQDMLNRSDDRLWGFVSNGLRLRILRDNVALTRQAYVEFDLQAMMDGEVYSDFVVLWLLAHQSRVEAATPEECWLERWSAEAQEQGARALDNLRDGVEAAIHALGSGFLAHPDNAMLREALRAGRIRPVDYYRQLLRVIYRLLFLLVAEQRDLLLLPPVDSDRATVANLERRSAARAVYNAHYSISRVRNLAERRRGTRHGDLWHQVQLVVRLLGTTGSDDLALPALGSYLFSTAATPQLDGSRLPNTALLAAVRALSGRDDDQAGYRWLFDYANLGVEELGSVYQSLLELHPDIDLGTGTFTLTTGGKERRATGSHYTPPAILKRVLDFAVEPAIVRALAAADPEAALLDLRVLDPAVGSGHFLNAVAHRIARALATVRSGEAAPPPGDVRRALREVVSRCVYGIDLNPMAVELCRVALWLETLDPGKPLSFLDHHIRVGNSLLGVPLGNTVARNRAAVDDRRVKLQEQERDLAQQLADLSALDPASPELNKKLRKLRSEIKACVYDSWADAVPDYAFKAVDPGEDKGKARAVARANARQRVTNQLRLSLDNVLVELPREIVDVFTEIGGGAEDDLAEVTIRAESFEGAQQSAEYQHLLLQAHTWTSAFFWPFTAGTPEPPTQESFITLKADPASLSAPVAGLVEAIAEARGFLHPELAFPDVFSTDRSGFDLALGNPPYLGGMKISSNFGGKVLHFLKSNHPADTGGREDLAAFFVRRSFDMLRPDGDLCFITTNSIGEGDTRDAALAPIVREWGGTIVNAISSIRWQGEAKVSVSIVHLRRGAWNGSRLLDGQPVEYINPSLTSAPDATPQPLGVNAGMVVKGTNLVGEGFAIGADQRRRMLSDDPNNAAIIKAFLGAKDILNSPDLQPRRWVIDFGAKTLEEAEAYREPMRHVREQVKPGRDKSNRKAYRERWWRFGEPSTNLYATIERRNLGSVLVLPETSKTALPVRAATQDVVFFQSLFVFMDDADDLYGLLTSSVHRMWVSREATTHETRIRYSADSCFMTFPRPEPSEAVAAEMRKLDQLRRSIMREHKVGLTDLYNLVDDTQCADPDIVHLRERHVALDVAVMEAYGWGGLVPRLSHGHHEIAKFGVRWTIAGGLHREVQERLLALNLNRAADEEDSPVQVSMV